MSEETPLFHRVVVTNAYQAAQLWEVLKQWRAMAARGRPMQVLVSEYAPPRAWQQNAKMWEGYLKPIAQQAKLPDGTRTNADGWHKIMKEMFLPEQCANGVKKYAYHDNGERSLVMSTGDLNEKEFEVYLHEVGSYATNELGVHLPVNPRDLIGTQYESEVKRNEPA